MTGAIEVAGVGMVTAIGEDTRATLAALEAGTRRMGDVAIVDLAGDRMAGAFAMPVHAALEGGARCVALAWSALRECLAEAGPCDGRTALFVCAPLPWAPIPDVFAPVLAPVRDEWSALVDALAEEAEIRGLRVPSALRVLVARGHAGGVLALQRAAALFARGEASQALIVGLDAHGERATLERLDVLGMLKSNRSLDGFTPGEAAAVLCVRPAAAGARGVLVRGLGLEVECERPSTARALTSAVAHAIEEWGGETKRIGTVAIDLNGERERAKEWSFAAMRTIYREHAAPTLVHPADRMGDVGAASVPLLVGLLARRLKESRTASALAVASSVDSLRGAVVLDLS